MGGEGFSTELFIEEIKKEIELCKEANFYLASDSEEDKRILTETFGSRIMTSDKPADRNKRKWHARCIGGNVHAGTNQ
jgi:hypothetical protein